MLFRTFQQGAELDPKILAVLAAGLLFTPVLAAHAQPAEGTLIQNWKITCADGPCRAFFNISQDGKIVVSWTLLHDPASDSATSIIKIPTGVALQPGLRIYADETTFFDAPYQLCEPDGCTAIIAMDKAMIEALGRQATARVAFVPYGGSQTTAYEVPVGGLGDALDAL